MDLALGFLVVFSAGGFFRRGFADVFIAMGHTKCSTNYYHADLGFCAGDDLFV